MKSRIFQKGIITSLILVAIITFASCDKKDNATTMSSYNISGMLQVAR